MITIRAAHDRLKSRQQELRAELDTLVPRQAEPVEPAEFVRAAWGGMSVAERRQRIRRYTLDRGDSILITRPAPGVRGADRVRIRAAWDK